MRYPYQCNCGNQEDIIKKISEIDNIELCSKCGSEMTRTIARGYFYGEKVEDAEYCPAVGQIVRNNKHRQQIAKSRGWEEVGNDSGKYFEEVARNKERARVRYWDELRGSL